MLQLRIERQRRGWSLAKLCARTGGIDPAVLSRIERAVWPAGPSWRRRIAEAFGMSEEALFKPVVEGEGEQCTCSQFKK
ncbi:MAG: helix-turn-helix transcriptional regulator [Bacillota bacterium]